MQDSRVGSLGWEDPPEKEMATHSSILAWKIPWTEGPRVEKSWTQLSDFTFFLSLLFLSLLSSAIVVQKQPQTIQT